MTVSDLTITRGEAWQAAQIQYTPDGHGTAVAHH
jgi:hypothetical protein